MITKAIIPVAGIGSRFLPASKSIPKEMFPIVDKPVIHYIVQGAVESGIKDIIFVTSSNKKVLEDYFDCSFELNKRLIKKGKNKLLKSVKALHKMANFCFVRQPEPLGCGDAVLRGAKMLQKNESAVVMWGDDVIIGSKPSLKELMQVYKRYQAPVLAVEKIEGKAIEKYGVIASKRLSKKTHKVNCIIEKPAYKDAPSNLGIVGKYIFTPDIFKTLAGQSPAKNGEVRTADALQTYIANGGDMYAYEFSGTRYDCGSKAGWLKANIALGLKHKDVKAELKEFLSSEL